MCWCALILVLTLSSSSLVTTAHKRANICTPINPMNITNCKKLLTLGAELGWNIHNETHIDILFTIPISMDDTPKWVAWGVNPRQKRPRMIGTRAIIAVSQANGTLKVSRYNITSDTKLGCRLQPLEPSKEFEDVVVQNMTGDVKPNRYMSIFATLILRPDLAHAYDIARLNHVWQVGYEADEVALEPKMHPTALQNVDSTETTNLHNWKGISIGYRRHHLGKLDQAPLETRACREFHPNAATVYLQFTCESVIPNQTLNPQINGAALGRCQMSWTHGDFRRGFVGSSVQSFN